MRGGAGGGGGGGGGGGAPTLIVDTGDDDSISEGDSGMVAKLLSVSVKRLDDSHAEDGGGRRNNQTKS